MRQFEINRISGVFESPDSTELLLESTTGSLMLVFRNDGGDLLDGVASALAALNTGSETDSVPESATARALDHLRRAVALLEGAEGESVTPLARAIFEGQGRSAASKAGRHSRS